MSHKPLIIIGAGGHARIVIDAAEQAGCQVEGILDIDFEGREERILGYPVLGDCSTLATFDPGETDIALAIGEGQKRAHYFSKVVARGFAVKTIIHPTAVISRHAQVGQGTLVNAGAYVNAGAHVGNDAIVNTAAIIEHEVTVGDHSHVGPGALIAGRVQVGHQTFIGIGATVIDKVKIGSRVTVGAGSVVIKDIEDGATVAGIPAKRLT